MKKIILALFVLSFGVTTFSFADGENRWNKREWRGHKEKGNRPPHQGKPNQ